MPAMNILIVDDDADIREAVADALGYAGHEVELAGNGREALDWLEAVPVGARLPDLILLDLMMPVMDGRAFIRELKQRHRLAGIRILVFTANDDAEDVAAVLNAVGYLQKPLRMNDLLGIVHQAALRPPPVSYQPPR
jgi:two-component system response regulator MprA